MVVGTAPNCIVLSLHISGFLVVFLSLFLFLHCLYIYLSYFLLFCSLLLPLFVSDFLWALFHSDNYESISVSQSLIYHLPTHSLTHIHSISPISMYRLSINQSTFSDMNSVSHFISCHSLFFFLFLSFLWCLFVSLPLFLFTVHHHFSINLSIFFGMTSSFILSPVIRFLSLSLLPLLYFFLSLSFSFNHNFSINLSIFSSITSSFIYLPSFAFFLYLSLNTLFLSLHTSFSLSQALLFNYLLVVSCLSGSPQHPRSTQAAVASSGGGCLMLCRDIYGHGL